ncbi:CocE/NonD family hydrolase [Klenkia sp. PcliD-1-E]|uniref:CocE/NonD family hydrolase n=1 Tax=Klenkia sp. PcliD-1-E TaxID=2954492 RepID=UPI00209786CB|nr:CocE/NonD family hydrolase [Klenkia sp. PcliD-1-E]MCO7218706.1 CocE/NonD family hydrolase [Klenkia sp. PcliD-1-E]
MRLVDRVASRVLGLPPATSAYTVERGLRVPMRDGVQLVADRYSPDGPVRGTLLVRGPYGRGFPFSLFFATAFAARGYQVVFQSVRGTYGSGDEFQPMFREVDDGADTVAWLRAQPWYTGSFGTVGLSYLGFTQWALLADPPEDLAASVVLVGPHDFSRATWGTGAFTVNDFLGWSDLVAHQEDPGRLRGLLRQVTGPRRLGPALDALPLGDAGERLLAGRGRWYRDWVAHPDRSDPWWTPVQLDRALDRSGVPVLLIGGWQDLFLEQTLDQYLRLRDAGADVALTVGPWTHTETLSRGGGLITRESLDWLGEHLAGTGPRSRPARVHVHVTGAGEWRWMPDWPPATEQRTVFLAGGGRLSDTAPGEDAPPATFVADPAEPTPSVGGRLLDNRSGGYADDTALAGRDDVAAWFSEPLPADLEVLGRPVLELHHGSDVGHVDVAVRLSRVDRRGRSRNVSDGYLRLVPGDPGTDPAGGTLRLELDAVAHRFPAGSRLRLVVAGSSHPHWARNTGTGEPPETAVRTVRSTRTVSVAGGASRLLLPVSPAGRTPGPASRG